MPHVCRGQAWTPPRGDGSVTFSYQWIDNTGHRLTDGTYINGGRSVDTSLYVEGEYAFTSRLSITAGLPGWRLNIPMRIHHRRRFLTFPWTNVTAGRPA